MCVGCVCDCVCVSVCVSERGQRQTDRDLACAVVGVAEARSAKPVISYRQCDYLRQTTARRVFEFSVDVTVWRPHSAFCALNCVTLICSHRGVHHKAGVLCVCMCVCAYVCLGIGVPRFRCNSFSAYTPYFLERAIKQHPICLHAPFGMRYTNQACFSLRITSILCCVHRFPCAYDGDGCGTAYHPMCTADFPKNKAGAPVCDLCRKDMK